jgi:hypothetical protein
VADVNGDGLPDLVTANQGSNTVSVFLGNGDGTFELAQTYATDSYPFSVAVADVNGDGHPDVVTANSKSDSVSVLLGNGDGSFRAARNLAVGGEPLSVAVVDVNGDGRPDLVLPSYGYGVNVLLGNGNGTFQAAQHFATGTYPVSAAVADVNGDGHPDIITANGNSSATLSVLLGNGNGTFLAAQKFATGADPIAVAVADLNGDGRPDLVTANFTGNTVSVLLGNGNGTFQTAQNVAVGSDPLSVALADLNGDGLPDILTANFRSNTVSVLLGHRNAATHFLVSAPASATAGTPFTITVTALTAGGQTDCNYTGTVKFSSSDHSDVLPAAYHFTLADGGVHTFTVTLNTTGSQTITATDKVNKTIKGKATVTVNSPAPRPSPAGGRSSGTGTASANAADGARAAALAGELAASRLLDTRANPTVLSVAALLADPRALPAAAPCCEPPRNVPVRDGVGMEDSGGLPPEEDQVQPEWGLADRDAFFAAEVLAAIEEPADRRS